MERAVGIERAAGMERALDASGWLLGGSTGGKVVGRRSGAREGTLPVGTNSRPLFRRSVRLRSSGRRALRCSSAASRSSLMVSSRELRNLDRVTGLRSCLCGSSFSISSKALRDSIGNVLLLPLLVHGTGRDWRVFFDRWLHVGRQFFRLMLHPQVPLHDTILVSDDWVRGSGSVGALIVEGWQVLGGVAPWPIPRLILLLLEMHAIVHDNVTNLESKASS